MRKGSLLPRLVPLLLVLGAAAITGDAASAPAPARGGRFARQSPFVVRPFRPFRGGRWIGNAIAYGPHRDGQQPGGPSPTRAQVREDLGLIAKHWGLLRVYGSVGPADSILSVITADRMDLEVLLGVWIEPEDRRDSTGRVLEALPAKRAENRAEVEAAVRLAAAHPGTVIALCVGNETQVSWSSHRVPPALLVGYVRELRARTGLPVTSADDYGYWKLPASRALARELDFVVMHAHPLWNGKQPAEALDWTVATWRGIRAAYPDREIVIGETGWATKRVDTGDQGKLMKGPVGEEPQAAFCRAFAEWAERERVPTFFFEAFDENWKGGPDPDDAEKHWGYFRADRTPKQVLR
jgi:exo-beta-1,3-glucanase (GH17 family)